MIYNLKTKCYEKTLKTKFKEGDNVLINEASSGIGVRIDKNSKGECWVIRWVEPKVKERKQKLNKLE